MCIFLCERNLNIFKSLKKQNETKRKKQNKINKQTSQNKAENKPSFLITYCYENNRTQVEKIFNSRCFLSSYVTIEVWIAKSFHRRK